jgi:hypothetical protein
VSPRRRSSSDPDARLIRLLERLSQRHQYVTLADLERSSSNRSSGLAGADLAAMIEDAVVDSRILKDLRTFFDRRTGEYADRWVYRVNPRHPAVAALLAED